MYVSLKIVMNEICYRIGHYFRGLRTFISRICAKKGFVNKIFSESRVLTWAVIQKLLFANPNFANRGSNREI